MTVSNGRANTKNGEASHLLEGKGIFLPIQVAYIYLILLSYTSIGMYACACHTPPFV